MTATGATGRVQITGSRAWTDAWRVPWFRTACFATGAYLAAALMMLSVVLTWVEKRSSVVAMDDPLLARLPARDVTWLTFGIIYVALTIGVWRLASSPWALLRGVRAYVLLVLLRALTMLLTPLAPPPGMILLSDPFADHLVSAPALTKDLFFSGHTSTMFLVFLATRERELRVFFAIGTCVVAAAVLVQHVHYTIDVVAAPAFAYVSWALSRRWVDRVAPR